MVRPERFELPTCCSGGNRSIQLSYGRTWDIYSLHAVGTSGNDGGILVVGRSDFIKTHYRNFAYAQVRQRLAPDPCRLPAVPTATAAFATTAATASTAPASSAGRTIRLRSRFVDVDSASAELRSIQPCDCLLPIFVAGHLDESEASGPAGVAVGHDADAIHLSIGLEGLPQFVFTGVEAEIPHENILHASASALSCRKCKLSSADLAGREGLPEIETGSWQQSIAAGSIAGFFKAACQ
jgi:hypothetical protein